MLCGVTTVPATVTFRTVLVPPPETVIDVEPTATERSVSVVPVKLLTEATDGFALTADVIAMDALNVCVCPAPLKLNDAGVNVNNGGAGLADVLEVVSFAAIAAPAATATPAIAPALAPAKPPAAAALAVTPLVEPVASLGATLFPNGFTPLEN
jgi:hypothetical protein